MKKTWDLLRFRDDKTVLRNPHKGWYWHYYDNGFGRPTYRDRWQEGEYYEDFPGLHHLYIRIDWADINIAPDVYDWSPIDELMDKWGAKGYKFSFRICCSETKENQCFATPKWLYEMGCKGMFIPPTPEEDPTWLTRKYTEEREGDMERIAGDKPHKYWEPDYGDPLFLKYLEKFMANYASKYDNDPRVEYIDLGTYGQWGEGHSAFGVRRTPPLEVMKKHAYLHVKYFKNTPVMLNDDFIGHALDFDEAFRKELYDYCLSLGMGLRDDSIIAGMHEIRDYHTIEHTDYFDDVYPHAPVDLELGHYTSYTKEAAKGGLVAIEAARRGHATYMGFHTYPEDWIKDNYYVTEYLANRLGYWYTINSIAHNDNTNPGVKLAIDLAIENMGFAGCYYKYSLCYKFKNKISGKEYTISDPDFDNRLIKHGETVNFRSTLSLPDDMEKGDYTISVKIAEKDTPIALALKEKIKEDNGYYNLSEITVL